MNAAKNQNKSFDEVVAKYRKTRETAHRNTVKRLRSVNSTGASHLQITPITDHALDVFKQQWNHAIRKVDWNWAAECEKWRSKRPSYWEMAIWHKQVLCGLVLGGPSRRRARLYVEGIEGNPETTPLKRQIISIALIGSEDYAESIGCKEIWLVAPAEEVIDLYLRAGYTLRPPNKLLAKVLRLKTFAVKAIGVI